MIETWKDVVGYEGRYQVSDLGRVRSVDRWVEYLWKGHAGKRFYRGKILQLQRAKSGHINAYLCRGAGDEGKVLVHVMVLEAFVGPRPGSSKEWQCCHGDGNPGNNLRTNLRWGTRSDNSKDKVLHGTSVRGTSNPKAKLDERDVASIRSLLTHSNRSTASISEEFGVSQNQIYWIRDGKSWGWLGASV